jgi:hypothetical protein
MSSSQRKLQFLQGKIALLTLDIEDDNKERMRLFRLTQKKEEELKRLQDLLREELLCIRDQVIGSQDECSTPNTFTIQPISSATTTLL